MDLNHFIKDGNVYRMKQHYGFNVILIAGIFAVAGAGYYIDLPMLMWIMLGLGILTILAIATKKLTIDLDKRIISVKIGLAKPATIIPIDSIQNFELETVSINLIRTNATLNVYYLNENGKEKSTQLAQSFTKHTIQHVLNEIEYILANAPTKR